MAFLDRSRCRDPRTRGAGRGRAASAASALATMLLLAGCSSVPDWANPVEWYDGLGSDNTTAAPDQKVSTDKQG